MEIIKIAITSLLSVAGIFIIAKFMGHKQVAQLDFFDYISGITIGSIAAEMATELESPWKFIVALVVYGAVSILLNTITQKCPKTRKFINGTPTIIMDSGKLYRKNMKKAKLDLSEFMLLCREEGYFDLEDIQSAVFEHNGKLSILPKADKAPLTPSDMNLFPKPADIASEIIMDGRIMGENLKRLGFDTAWLEKRLKSLGYESEKEIFLALYRSTSDTLTIYPNAEKEK